MYCLCLVELGISSGGGGIQSEFLVGCVVRFSKPCPFSDLASKSHTRFSNFRKPINANPSLKVNRGFHRRSLKWA